MTLSTQSCPLHEMMLGWVRAGAESVEGIGEVEIDLVFEPMWNIDMAEDHVKEALGRF